MLGGQGQEGALDLEGAGMLLEPVLLTGPHCVTHLFQYITIETALELRCPGAGELGHDPLHCVEVQHLPVGGLALCGDALEPGVLRLPDQGMVNHVVDSSISLQPSAGVAGIVGFCV